MGYDYDEGIYRNSLIKNKIILPIIHQSNNLWVIKSNKSKYQGKSLESLMFQDYGYLNYLLQKNKANSCNSLYVHLENLLQKGENRRTIDYCRFCHNQFINWFSVQILASGMTCCYLCKDKLKLDTNDKYPESVSLYPLKFSVLKNFSRSQAKAIALNIFKPAFGLKDLSVKNLQNFFYSY